MLDAIEKWRSKQKPIPNVSDAIRRLVELGLKSKGKLLQRSCPMPKARDFDAAKYHDNPKMIARYLNHALATGDAILITQAIGDMIRAQGVTRVSQRVGLRRDSLYRSFRGHMGPRFETVMKAITALNIQLVAKPSSRLVKLGLKVRTPK
jgi:probable addiction module antidote protein